MVVLLGLPALPTSVHCPRYRSTCEHRGNEELVPVAYLATGILLLVLRGHEHVNLSGMQEYLSYQSPRWPAGVSSSGTYTEIACISIDNTSSGDGSMLSTSMATPGCRLLNNV